MTSSAALTTALASAWRVAHVVDFPTVDALLSEMDTLAQMHPTTVRRTCLGHSRRGEPIEEFAIGNGSRHFVIVGGVHPNEPIGFRTVEHLARELLDDENLTVGLDATWHLVPCIDPDGTRLNEAWFGAPADRVRYARGFYRPAPDEQVEWSFPFAYKRAMFDRPLPETRALMALCDRVRPALFVGLHNAELGGVYYYVTRALPGIVDALMAIPHELGLPADAGEPESAELERIGGAVFRTPLARERYDYLDERGIDPVAEVSGGGSADYLQQFGTFSLVAELPYWTHPDAADTDPSGVSYRDVLREKASDLRTLAATLTVTLAAVSADLVLDTPFRRATTAFAHLMGSLSDAEQLRADAEADRVATRAEVFSNEDVVRCFRLRFGGMMLRMLDAECTAGTATAAVRRERDRFAAVYDHWCTEAESVPGIEPLPIERLVGVQVASTLVAAALLNNDRESVHR